MTVPGHPLYRLATGIVLAMPLASACATRTGPPLAASDVRVAPASDEPALWARAEREEAALRQRITLHEDASLAAYLGEVADRLARHATRDAGSASFEFRVIRDPTLNAFAMPNGPIYLHTGLLARLENEAQLAAILAHEIIHVMRRHALQLQRRDAACPRFDSIAALGLSIGIAAAAGSRDDSGEERATAALGPTASAVLGLDLGLATVASITGYGRHLEGEADAHGMDLLVKAGYDPREAPAVFALLAQDSDDRGVLETFFLGTRRHLRERHRRTRALVARRHADAGGSTAGVRDTDDFSRRLRAVVRENAALDIRAGRYELARRQLDRVLALTPRDPMAHVYYGDLHRRRAQRAPSAADSAEHTRRALERYARAVALDPTGAETFRQLGLLHVQQRDRSRARAAFERYLALAPAAPDAVRIQEYVIELGR